LRVATNKKIKLNDFATAPVPMYREVTMYKVFGSLVQESIIAIRFFF
jgi:hypothetical protein